MENQIKEIFKLRKKKRLLKRSLAILCVITLIFTMNALKRDATALDRIAMCGYAEHVHSQSCFDGNDLICGLEGHVHSDACYQETPTVTGIDDLDIELEMPEAGDRFPDMNLSLDLDDSALVTEDVETKQPVFNEEEEWVYSLGTGAMVSQIIEALQMNVVLDDIVEVSAVENDDRPTGLIAVEQVENDYRVWAQSNFDVAKLALITANDILVVELREGFAPENTSSEDEQPVEVDVPVVDDPLIRDVAPAETEQSVDKPAFVVKEPSALESGVIEQGQTSGEDDPSTDETLADEAVLDETDEQPAEDQLDSAMTEGHSQEGTMLSGEEEDDADQAEDKQPPFEEPVLEEMQQSLEGDEPTWEEAELPAVEEQSTKDEVQPTDTETGKPAEQEQFVDEAEQPAEEQSTDEAEPSAGQEQSVDKIEQPAGEQSIDEAEPSSEQEMPVDEAEQPVGEQSIDEAEPSSEQEMPVDEAEQPVGKQSTDEAEPSAEQEQSVDEAEQPDGEQSTDEAEPSAEQEQSVDEAEQPVGEQSTDEAEPSAEQEQLIQEKQPAVEQDQTAEAEAPAEKEKPQEEPLEGQSGEAIDAEVSDQAVEDQIGEELTATDEDRQLPESVYPAQDYEGNTESVTVFASAPEGAFPEGTVMSVVDVEDAQTITDIEETVSADFIEVKRVHAVDITFRDAQGNEIEPRVPISVVMTVAEIDRQQEAVVVHVDDEGEPAVVESLNDSPVGETEVRLELAASETVDTKESEQTAGDAVSFEADRFSVYAIVVTQAIETKYIDAEGEAWKISVGYGIDAGIPSSAKLVVAEVADEAYLSQTEEALEGDRRIELARFFDITIMDGEREIQPDAPVTVNVVLDTPAEADAVQAVHFSGENVELLEAENAEGVVTFEAGSFSVYGIVYTVDFEYTDSETHESYTYNLAGGGEMLLSELFESLKIKADLTGSAARFSDDMPEGLVELAPMYDEDGKTVADWKITSLAPFADEYQLIVNLADGQEIVIGVTDAQSGSCGDNLTWTLDEAGNLAITGTGAITSHPWTAVSVRTVTIDEGVTAICGGAFEGCSNLTSAVLPESLTSIGEKAFNNCKKLAIDLDFTRMENLAVIGPNAFNWCSSATGINLNGLKNLRTIGNNAFSNCNSVETVNLSGADNLTNVGVFAFENNYNLTSVRLPDTLTSIPEGMFHCNDNGKSQLTTVEFNNWENLEYLGGRAFRNCNKLVMDVGETLSKATKLPSIGANTFTNCKNLTGTLMMSSLTGLGSSAFQGTGITGVDLKACHMTAMGDHAFAACPNLETLILPDSIEILNNYSFENNKTLKTVGIPASMVGKPLPEGLFNNCSNLTTLVVPDDYWKSVPSIGAKAFYGCSFLEMEGLDFSGSTALSSIGSQAFQGCSNIKGTLDLSGIEATPDRPALVINDHAFANAGFTGATFEGSTALTKVDVCALENIKTAGSSSYTLASVNFSGCTSLKTLGSGAFKNAVMTVADFTNCTSLESVSVPRDNYIESAFYLCDNLDTLIFRGCSAITEIGPNAFNLGSKLKLVDLTECENLQKIDYNAFRGLTNCEILLPSLKNVTVIGNSAFQGNTIISEIDLSGSPVSSIGENAFSGCTSLSKLDLSDCVQLTTIGAKALEGCSQIKTLVIPKGVDSIASDAFTGCAFNKAITWDVEDYDGNDETKAALSPGVFAASRSYTLNIGQHVQKLPQNFFKAIEKAGEVYFPLKQTIELGNNVNTDVSKIPFKNFTPGMKIYTDENGVVYRLDSDNTATIVYCNPKPRATDNLGISSYHVPSALTVNGENYAVNSIAENAFACAKDLEYVTFEDAGQLAVSDDAFMGLRKLNLLADLKKLGNDFDYSAIRALVEKFIENGVVVKSKYVDIDGEPSTYEQAILSKGLAATITDATKLFNGVAPTGAFFDTGLLDDTVHPWDGNTQRASEFEVKQANGSGYSSIRLEAAMPSASKTDDETVYPRVSEDHLYTLLTGEPFGLRATVQGGGENSTFRVYLAFSSVSMGDLPENLEIEIKDGEETRKLQAEYKKIAELANTWCLEIPLTGSQTASATLSFSYPSPASGESTLRVWADVLEKQNPSEDEWKKGKDAEEKSIYEIPLSANASNVHNYLQADWKVNRQNRVVTKGATATQVSLVGDGDASTDATQNHDFNVSAFGWTIALPYADPSSARVNKGQDLIVQADLSDDITLPVGIRWNTRVLDAIRNQTYTIVRSGDNPYEDHHIMQVDGVPVLYLALPGDAESDMPEFNVDKNGQVNVSWKLVNPYKTTDLTQNDSRIYFYDGTLVMNLEDVYIDDEKNYVAEGTEGAHLARESDFPLVFNIPNRANAVLHYTHSNTVTITSNEKVVPARAEPANLKIGKNRSGSGEMRMGDAVEYTLTARNVGAGTATHDVTVADVLPDRQYIPAAELEKLFRDSVYQENDTAASYGQYLTVTIKNATHYSSDIAEGTAVAIDGKGSVRVYDENSGTMSAEGASGDLTISYANGTYTGRFGSEVLAYTSIEQLLEAFGYHVDADDVYEVKWVFPKDQFRYAGGLTQVFPIGARNKDTFQMLLKDTPIRYMWDEDIDWEDIVSNTADIYDGDELANQSGTTSFVIKPEYNIRKYLTRGIGTVDDAAEHRYGYNPVVDYRVNVYNASTQDGNGRNDMPVTDEMEGAQLVLVPKDGNSLTAPVVTVGGTKYHVLTVGTYSHVVMQDGLVAESVTVTGSAPDYNTQVKWYLPHLLAKENEELHLRVMLLANDPDDPDGKPYTDYSFCNTAYLNDRSDDRLFDTVGEGGSAYGMSKKIVTHRGDSYTGDVLDDNDLSWITVADNAPLYRISIDFDPRKPEWSASVPWRSIYDELPKTYGAFEWDDTNVSIDGVETSGNVDGTEGVDAIDDWQFERNEKTGQWEMRPTGAGAITLTGTSHVYIYVRLTFPKDQWQSYCGKVRGGLISNTAHVGQRSDTVYHEVKTQAGAWLQKGVNYIYNVGTTSSRTEYSNIAGGIEYYTVLYNSGDDRLYLNDFVDNLPRGFHFVRLAGYTHAWQPGGKIDPAAPAITSATSNAVNLGTGDAVTFREARLTPHVVTDYAGNETVTFSVEGSSSATLSILKDESGSEANGFWYLMPGEAIAFTYCVQVDENAVNTVDSAVNTIRMAYKDPAMLGVEVDDGDVVFSGCARTDTDEFNDGTAISYNGGQGIQSNVTVTRGEILPGVAKSATQYSSTLPLSEETFRYFPDGNSVNDSFIYHAKWLVDAENNGTAEINGYTIEETMQSPYRFRGDVNYMVYRYDGESGTRMLAPYASASATAPGYLFKIISTDDEGVQVMGMNNATTKVLFNADAPTLFTIPEVRNLVNNTREYNLQFGLSFRMLPDGSEKMILAFPEGTLPVVPFGYGRLELITSTGTQVSNTEITNIVMFKPNNTGYTLTGDGQRVTDELGNNVGIQNWDSFICQIGSVTDAEKKVTAKNYAGVDVTKTSRNPRDNVVTLVDARQVFTYTLEVANQTNGSKMNRLVIVDNLPQAGDVETINTSKARNSEFRVNFKLTDANALQGLKVVVNDVVLSPEQYTVEFCDEGTITLADRMAVTGEDTPGRWHAAPTENSRSIRIIIQGIDSSKKAQVCFDAEQTGGTPGQIAYNGFAYYYELEGVEEGKGVAAAPRVVGVRIPRYPTITKTVFDLQDSAKPLTEDRDFYFLVYRGKKEQNYTQWYTLTNSGVPTLNSPLPSDVNAQIVKVTVPAGASASPMPESNQMYQYGFWRSGDIYTIVEIPTSERFQLLGWDVYTGTRKSTIRNGAVEFEYRDTRTKAFTARNRDRFWDLKVTKTDIETGKPLANAVFGIYSLNESDRIDSDAYPDKLVYSIPIDGEVKTWYLANVMTTGEDGVIQWKDRQEKYYLVRELVAPNYYSLADPDYIIIQPTSGEEAFADEPMKGTVTITKKLAGLPEDKENEDTIRSFAFMATFTCDGQTTEEAFELYAKKGEIEIEGETVDRTITQTFEEIRYGTVFTLEEELNADFTVSVSQANIPIEPDDDGKYTFTLDADTDGMSFDFVVTNTRKSQKISVKKVNVDDLPIPTGARFALYRSEDYDDEAEAPRAEAEPLIEGMTDENALWELDECGVGHYRLVETQAPEGYNRLDKAVRIDVSPDGVTYSKGGSYVPAEKDEEGVYIILVPNTPGAKLPSTGGPGTGLFTAAGLCLILLALALLLRRKFLYCKSDH